MTTTEDILSTVEDIIIHLGGYHEYRGGSVLWEDIIFCCLSTMEGYHDTCGGYHEYCGEVLITVEELK